MYFQKVSRRKKIKISFLLASWRSMTKIAVSGSRIRIHWSEAWIRGSGSGSTPKCHRSATLLLRFQKSGCRRGTAKKTLWVHDNDILQDWFSTIQLSETERHRFWEIFGECVIRRWLILVQLCARAVNQRVAFAHSVWISAFQLVAELFSEFYIFLCEIC